jgi:hypothetical protein
LSGGDVLNVNPADLRGYGSRTHARTADFHYEPADSEGDWPSHHSVRRFHGQVQATGQGLSTDLDGSADHAERSADEHDKHDDSASKQMSTLMGMASGLLKDGMGAATDMGKSLTTMATTVGTAATQSLTTGLNAAMTAATGGAKGGQPGGAPVPLAAGTGSVPESPTTGHEEKGRDHGDADADSHV